MHVEPGDGHRIALIGATGRVGRAVARVLASADASYRALSRDAERARRVLGSHAHVVEGDLRDARSIEELVRGVERLLVVSSAPALEADAIARAARAGVARIVKVSALGRGDACSEVHCDAEDALRASGARWTLVRPTALMQTLADDLAAVARDAVVRLPAGEAAVGWVDARDVAAVVVHALVEDHAGQTWTVSGPEALPVRRAIELVASATGRPLRYVPGDPASARAELAALAPARADDLEARCAQWRTGDLAVVTDVVRRVARVEPRSFARFAATHDFGLEVERTSRSAVR